MRISPKTFEPDVSQASFKYVRVQQDKTYSFKGCAPKKCKVTIFLKQFDWFIEHNKY